MSDLDRLRALAGLPGAGPSTIVNGTLRQVGDLTEVYIDGEWIKATIEDLESEDDEAFNMSEHRALLETYDEANPKCVAITEIVVPTERDRAQVLAAIKYLHDNLSINTDFYAVNTLVHLYQVPDRIKVKA